MDLLTNRLKGWLEKPLDQAKTRCQKVLLKEVDGLSGI